MSGYLFALSDAGKTKISIRFDETDGILKYYKEFGSICCHLKGPPSTLVKACLLDNSMKEISVATDSGVLAVSNHETLRTDAKGDLSFNCVVNKGCQAYDSMFFVICVSWGTNEAMISAPFVSGSKGPAEAMNDKNRFRPKFISHTSLSAFKQLSYFTCENAMQKTTDHITQLLHDGKELRAYRGVPSQSLFNTQYFGSYYKAKTRSQSHKLDVVERVDVIDYDAKIKEKLSMAVTGLVQLLHKGVARQQISEKDSCKLAADIPNMFNEMFQIEFHNIQQTESVVSDGIMSPKEKKASLRNSSTAKSQLVITPLARGSSLVKFKQEPALNNGSSSNSNSNSGVSANNKRNRTQFSEGDEWINNANTAVTTKSGRLVFPKPNARLNPSNSSSRATRANSKVDAESAFPLFDYRSGSVGSVGGALTTNDDVDDEDQFLNSQNSLTSTGWKGDISRMGSINPHAFDDDHDNNVNAVSVSSTLNSVYANSIRVGIANVKKGIFSNGNRDNVLDELAASSQNFDSMVTKDSITDSQVDLLNSLTRTNTQVDDCEMLFNSDDLMRSTTLKNEVENGTNNNNNNASTRVNSFDIGMSMLISAIDSKNAALEKNAREACISVNNTQESQPVAAEGAVNGGGEHTVTTILHDSFAGDWIMTQSQ